MFLPAVVRQVSRYGQVLDYALSIFTSGGRAHGPKAFDRVVLVFDHDEHKTYHQALAKAAGQRGKLKNDNGAAVPLDVVASVPCFELWLLLHFEDVHAPLHRHDALARLKAHLPDYEKGGGGHWAATNPRRRWQPSAPSDWPSPRTPTTASNPIPPCTSWSRVLCI